MPSQARPAARWQCRLLLCSNREMLQLPPELGTRSASPTPCAQGGAESKRSVQNQGHQPQPTSSERAHLTPYYQPRARSGFWEKAETGAPSAERVSRCSGAQDMAGSQENLTRAGPLHAGQGAEPPAHPCQPARPTSILPSLLPSVSPSLPLYCLCLSVSLSVSVSLHLKLFVPPSLFLSHTPTYIYKTSNHKQKEMEDTKSLSLAAERHCQFKWSM